MTNLRGITTAVGSGTDVTLTIPAGVTDTDGLFALITHDQGVGIPINPDQWTPVTAVFGATTLRLYRYTKSAVGTGPWTFVLSAASTWAASVIALTASATAGSTRAVVDVLLSELPASSNTAAVSSGVTPTAADDVVLTAVSWGRGTTFTPPAGLTEQADARSGNAATDKTLWLGSQVLTGGANTPTGAKTVTNDNPFGATAQGHTVLTVAFKSSPPPTSWVGDFSTGDLTQWALNQSAPGRVQILSDTPPPGFGNYARLVCLNADVAPITPTDNPRAQLTGPTILFPGGTRWFSWATRFPADFPVFPQQNPSGVNSFFGFSQIHGSPYIGSPQIGCYVNPGDRLYFGGSQFPLPLWETALIRGQWLQFAWRIYFAKDDTGWVELYYQGQLQRLRNGTTRQYMTTIKPEDDIGCEWDLMSYRRLDIAESVTIDHAAARLDVNPPTPLASVVLTDRTARTTTGVGSLVRARVVG